MRNFHCFYCTGWASKSDMHYAVLVGFQVVHKFKLKTKPIPGVRPRRSNSPACFSPLSISTHTDGARVTHATKQEPNGTEEKEREKQWSKLAKETALQQNKWKFGRVKLCKLSYIHIVIGWAHRVG